MSARLATVDDRARAVRTAVRAFVADPLIRWFFPDDDTYEEYSGIFFGLLFDLRVDDSEVWCTDDAVAVAMWDVPLVGGATRGGDDLWNTTVARLPERSRGCLETMGTAVGPHQLQEPHWYLGILATHPDWQRQGLGQAVMAPVLAKADADGVRCELLTESPENVAFYRGRGFAVLAEPVLDDGPDVWVMVREPGAGSA